MRILILGASGLVGGNCLKYFNEIPGVEAVGTYFSFEAPGTHYYDTLNPENPENFDVSGFKPTHILHAGALTHVDYCEEHPEESYRQTVESTKNAVKLANKFGASIIYISTDYVFDGKNGPYDENADINPLSIYAKHKWEAEEYIRNHTEYNLILRITNVYGDEIRNKNFVSRLMNVAAKKENLELKLPTDQYATPINAHDVAKAIYLLLKDNKTGVYHLASTDYLNRVQLAQKVLSYYPGHNVKIEAIETKALNQPAPRPLQGGLKAHKFLEEYPFFSFGSVDNYMASRKA